MPKSKHKRRRSNNTSGFIGVIKISIGYRAWISTNGKKKYIGSSYDTAKQAAEARDKEAIKLRRPFSQLNFPKTAPVGYTPVQKPLRSTNTVGYRGVSKEVLGKKFVAQITIGGKHTRIGSYDTAKEAAIVFDRAVLKANKSTTLLNFPDMVHNLDVEQKRTKQKVYSNNTSGYKGVSKRGNKFRAIIRIGGKKKEICGFNSAIAAALAYDRAAIKKGNKSHTLNFPDGFPIQVESGVEESTAFFV